MLCAVGDAVDDIVVWLSEPIHPGTDTPARIVRRRGGSAANVAVFAAFVEGRARFVGSIGEGADAEWLRHELAAAGVDAIVQCRGAVARIVVIVDRDGERTMLTDRGAATALDRVPDRALDGVSVLHVPTYSLVDGPLAAAAITAIGEAHRRRILVSIDASSVSVLEAFGIPQYRRLIDRLMPDVFLCNRDEQHALGLADGQRLGNSTITVVKAGGEPATVVTASGPLAVPVPPVERVIDTTGAGDAFAAGYLVALAHGADPYAAADGGHRLAARVLTQPGATVA